MWFGVVGFEILVGEGACDDGGVSEDGNALFRILVRLGFGKVSPVSAELMSLDLVLRGAGVLRISVL